jgi:Trp operon repressor
MPVIKKETKNREIRGYITEFEIDKGKLFLKLIKFISNLKEFDKLHQILHTITTKDELNNFKLKYNL